MPERKLPISEGAKAILERIRGLGEAYLVGGAVRDFLLGREVHDEDLATSLTPEEVIALFPDKPVLKTGLRHGTVTILWEHRPVEVTTYRVDGLYLDGRRPESVRFTRSLKEDLARRDFTVNAMALGTDGELIDPFGGEQDLREGVIRAVGEPEKRFQEDALRILRGLRFANRLGFSIESGTLRALTKSACLLKQVSRERIADEFLQIVQDRAEGVTLLHELGILSKVCPELDSCFHCAQETPYHFLDVGRHSVLAASLGEGLRFRLTMLFHDIGKPACKTYGEDGRAHFYGHAHLSAAIGAQCLRDFFLPEKERGIITRLIELHDLLSARRSRMARLVREEQAEVTELLPAVKRADVMAQSPLEREEKLAVINEQEKWIRHFLAGPHSLRDLPVDGRDLLELGYRGSEIRQELESILSLVMSYPHKNERKLLLARSEERLLRKQKENEIGASGSISAEILYNEPQKGS